jgi:hypothetical protein
VATKFCLDCGGEFVATVDVCPDCELELVDERPEDHLDPDEDQPDGQIEYQLHPWAGESRVMLEQLLQSEGIRHAWEGADLLVSAADEARVDALLAQVEVTTLPTLDPDAPKIAYGIDDWTDEQQTELMHELEAVGISYEFDAEGALVVLEEDDERVEAILDRIEFPDGVPVAIDEDDDDGSDDDEDDGAEDEEDAEEDEEEDDDEEYEEEEYDGLEAADVMSDLFVAADRLMHHADDPEGVLSLVDRAADAAKMPLPYGFDRGLWADIVLQAGALKSLIEDDDSEDDAIKEHAATLRGTLRTYV